MFLLQEYVRERHGDPSTTAPPPNPLMMGMDAGGYVLKAVGSVKVHILSPLVDFDVRFYCQRVTQLVVSAYHPRTVSRITLQHQTCIFLLVVKFA